MLQNNVGSIMNRYYHRTTLRMQPYRGLVMENVLKKIPSHFKQCLFKLCVFFFFCLILTQIYE